MMSSDRRPILLTADEVHRALPMADAIRAMRGGFEALSTGRASVPLREVIALDGFDGSALFMPAFDPALSAFGIKVIGVHDESVTRIEDVAHAIVLLFSASNGGLEALLDGRSLTAIRTGAGSGLATDLLARKDAHVAVIFGAGVQARSHLEAVCAVRDIDQAYVIGRSRDRAEEFVAEMTSKLVIPIEVDDGSKLSVADVICTTTTATEPILQLDQVKPGVHINAVGTHRPTDAEIDADLIRASKLVVDHREACLSEAGEIVRAIRKGVIDESHIFAEVGEIVAGLKPGREHDSEITIFKSVGNAIQDLAAASMALKNARRLDLGKPLDL